MKGNLLKINAVLIIAVILVWLFIPSYFPFLTEALNSVQSSVKVSGYNIQRALQVNSIVNAQTSNHSNLVIIFDDGYECVFLNAYPVLKKYNYKANISVIGSLIGEYEYMSDVQLGKLYLDGYDMLNHSFNHKQEVALSKNELIKEYRRCKIKLLSKGYYRGFNIIVLPGGKYIGSHLDIASDGKYKAIRSLDECYITKKEKVTDIEMINVYGSRSIDEILSLITEYKNQGKNIILIFHRINIEKSTSDMDISKKTLIRILGHIDREDINVLTFSKLLETY
jgi:peptidoglycan/xylan/chitin deacetylase (PgdA/CDA1 family)